MPDTLLLFLSLVFRCLNDTQKNAETKAESGPTTQGWKRFLYWRISGSQLVELCVGAFSRFIILIMF